LLITQLVLRSKLNNIRRNFTQTSLDNNTDITQKPILHEYVSDNFEFSLGISDTILTLTANKSKFKENTITLINKMFITRELININIDTLNTSLYAMNVEKLFIFVVNDNIDANMIARITAKNNPNVIYIELNTVNFINFLNEKDRNFLDYNKHSIYIIRNDNFRKIKNIFSRISNCNVNIGRGGSQKSHGLSPLDLRLSSYIMAMLNFDYKDISSLNFFDYMDKDRYLSWMVRTNFKKVSLYKEYKPMVINKMPYYCTNKNLGQYYLECAKIEG